MGKRRGRPQSKNTVEDEGEIVLNETNVVDEPVDDEESPEKQFFSDSEEEEWDNPNRNTVGNIPMEYYNDFDHIGYNINGEKILKPQTKDELDKFLAKQDDPNYW
jgi:ribosome biogenesis protein ERB1